MRGKARRPDPLPPWGGITPAYAGKRPFRPGRAPCTPDHPRVCGEKCLWPWTLGAPLGSPPRMRGKVEGTKAVCHLKGITPAYAGKRITRHTHNFLSRDHPRVCGEKALNWAGISEAQGSPPRMRGKAPASPPFELPHRITPAYAGKSCAAMVSGFWSRDHPRVCGEKTLKALKYKRLFFRTLKFPLTSDNRH